MVQHARLRNLQKLVTTNSGLIEIIPLNTKRCLYFDVDLPGVNDRSMVEKCEEAVLSRKPPQETLVIKTVFMLQAALKTSYKTNVVLGADLSNDGNSLQQNIPSLNYDQSGRGTRLVFLS